MDFPPIEPLDRQELSAFITNLEESIKRLQETGQPQALTIDGVATIVVQEREAYKRILTRLDEAEDTLGIREAMDDVSRGGPGVSVEEAFGELRQELEDRVRKAS